MQRRSASIGLVVGVFAVAAAIGVAIVLMRDPAKGQTTGSSKDAPITILWIGDTTGPAKAYGAVQLAGVKGAADYFNERGGIDGHRVVVDAVSDNSDPAVAASLLTQRLSADPPTMVWAGSTSIDSAPMIPILARHDVFAITLTDAGQCQGNAAQACPHEWALAVPSDVAPRAAVDWIEAQGFTKVGLLEPTTDYSATEAREVEKAAKAKGIAVQSASFPPTAVDLTPQMQALQAGGADVVFAEGIGAAQYAYAARAGLQWDVPMVFDPSASALDLTKLTSSDNLADSYQVTLFGQDASTHVPALATMVEYAGKHGEVTAIPLNVTSTGWDAVVALNAAVQQANGSLAVADLDRAMLDLPPTDPLRTLTHELGFTEDNHANVRGPLDDYVVIPVGPLVDGRVDTP